MNWRTEITKPEQVARFGLDRPWDDMATAPPLVRKNRGMIALARDLLCREATADTERLGGVLDSASEMFAAMERGEDYFAGKRGTFWCAHYSRADGTGQPFVISVPQDLDPDRECPLLLDMHGGGGRPTPRADSPYTRPYITIQPWGRGDVSWLCLGQVDALEALAYVREWYRIDPQRIHIKGYSMGSYGATALATAMPDLFATAHLGLGVDGTFPLGNLLHIPVFSQQGQEDWVSGIETTRSSVRTLLELGYSIVHKEFPNQPHSIKTPLDVDDWMLPRSSPPSPRHITFTCTDPARGRAYWANIASFADVHEEARVSICLERPGDTQVLSLAANNVSRMELDIEHSPVDYSQPLRLQAGRDLHELGAPIPERLFLTRKQTSDPNDPQWALSPSREADGSDAPAYTPGGALRLYDGDPLLIVYGTPEDQAASRKLKTAAENLSRYGGVSYSPMATGRIPTKPDADVTEEDLERYNLILIGRADQNLLAARVLADLPVDVTSDNELLTGSRPPLPLDGSALGIAAFNPLAQSRLVVCLSGYFDGDDEDAWVFDIQAFLPALDNVTRIYQPDLIVRAADRRIRRLMQFDANWRWREPELAETPLPGDESAPDLLHTARLRLIQRSSRADYVLWWGDGDLGYWNVLKDALEFEWPYATKGDLSAAPGKGRVIAGHVSGEELKDIHRRWVAARKFRTFPSLEPAELNDKRLYRIAMPPYLSYVLCARQRNMIDVGTAPPWHMSELLQELYT